MSSEISRTTIDETARLIQETAVEIAWNQWGTLGAGASTTTNGRSGSIIDPEALLLMSLTMQDAERRLADFSAWWAAVGSELLSVQRTKTMRKDFPKAAGERLNDFARLALEAGDRRWARYASSDMPEWGTRRLKGTETPRLTENATLMVRLRAGFGINAKADTLSFLLGTGGDAAVVHEIAQAINYSDVAVRNALKDMVMARLIHETRDHPARYYIDHAKWADLLNLRPSSDGEAPSWAYWNTMNSFLANAHILYDEANVDTKSAYLLSTKCRDLVERHGHAFSKNRIPIPRPSDYRGAAYLEGFLETVKSVRTWVGEVL